MRNCRKVLLWILTAVGCAGFGFLWMKLDDLLSDPHELTLFENEE